MKMLLWFIVFIGIAESQAQSRSSQFQLSLFTDNQFYLSPKSRKEQLNIYTNVGSEFYTQEEYKYWFYNLDSKLQVSLDQSDQNYISVPRANIGWHLKDIVSPYSYLTFIKVSIGRYIGNWSKMDKQWQLGLWNPSNLYDPLRPKSLGIVGSTITFGGAHWQIESFIGGAFLPDERPSLKTEASGKAISPSRWISAPSSNISFFEQDIYSYYKVEKPYLKNVLLQTSYMGQLILGDFNEKWISISYAYKPLNQIFFRANSGLSLPDSVIENTIYYHSLKHQLGTIESGFKIGNWKGYAGILNEQIDPVNLPQNWLFPVIPNYFFATVGLSKDFDFPSWMKNSIELAFLKSWLRDPNHSSNVISSDVADIISLDRLKMREGFSLSWSSILSLSGRKWSQIFLRYWYSIDQKGGWLESHLYFYILKTLSLELELDILGKESLYREGFFGKYGGNDRIIARLRYEF